MDKQQIPFYLAFNCIYRLRSKHVVGILNSFGGDAESAWHHPEKWAEAAGLAPAAAEDALAQKLNLDPQSLYGQFLNAGCGVTFYTDEDYPLLLDQIYDPPLVLFYRGSLPDADDLTIAIIGSRKATPYGKQVANIFARDLATQGAWIVSGMARGIDSICHKGALEAGGKTLAVLGCGIDVIYPPENSRLYADICDNGAVVSEFPLGTAALAQNFPRRNRIISGLSRGVVVVEAGANSGTMHTVNYALEQGKDIFAVPGPITSPCSKGTNKLIKESPMMVMATCADDIWKLYSDKPMRRANIRKSGGKTAGSGDEKERAVLELLTLPMQIDEIAEKTGMTAAQVGAELTMMEINGTVKQLPGKYYQATVKKI